MRVSLTVNGEQHTADDVWPGTRASRASAGGPLTDDVLDRFGTLVAAAAGPIDDVRGSAAYRRHALAVLACHTLTCAWQEYTGSR